MRTIVALIAASAALAGCPRASRPVPPDPVAEPLMEPATERVVFMHVMLDRADRARQHLIAGEVGEARIRAKEMPVDDEPPWVPTAWEPLVGQAYDSVRALQTAETLPAAAEAASQLAVSCGTCHEQAGVQAQVRGVLAPGERTAEGTRMERHLWAADWMWAGLVSADPRLYDLGASLFLVDSMPPLPEAAAGRADLEAMVARVDSVAVHARNAETWPDRATRYGELVTTCAACHLALGIGPTVPTP